MTALVLAQVPYSDIPTSIAADQLTLIGMYYDVVDGTTMIVISLHRAGLRVPDLHGSVLGRGDHPFGIAVKSNASDIVGMAFEGQSRVCICGTHTI